MNGIRERQHRERPGRLREPHLAEIHHHHRQQMNKHHGVANSQVARKLLASSMPFAPEANLSILQK
jgi:hypothetical protein